jgi:hypothetical protein
MDNPKWHVRALLVHGSKAAPGTIVAEGEAPRLLRERRRERCYAGGTRAETERSGAPPKKRTEKETAEFGPIAFGKIRKRAEWRTTSVTVTTPDSGLQRD